MQAGALGSGQQLSSRPISISRETQVQLACTLSHWLFSPLSLSSEGYLQAVTRMGITKGVLISRSFQLKFPGRLSLGWQVMCLSVNQAFGQENNKMP